MEGSLHVDSNLMTTHLSIMPEEARKLVEEEGGLREFLSQSSLFAVESDIVTNLEEKLFTDLSKSYKKSQEASFNAVTEKKNGSTSVEDLGPLLKRSDSAEYQPESMNSLSNIEEDSHADSRLKTSIYATKSPDLNYRSKTGRLNLSSNNDVSNEEHSSQETGEVINWDEEMSDQIELELQQEYALQEPRNAEDKKENVDKTLNNGSSHSLPNLVESSFLPTKANLSQLNDAVNGFEKSFNDEKTLRTENTYTSGDSTDIVSLTMSDKDVAANREKNDLYKKITKNEQNERAKRHDIYPSSKRTMTEGSAVVVDTKSTKEKGIQAQATVKHKAVTTESMTEPYKMEYEKLLQESESWNIRHQEALDKNVQLQKKYNLELLNLNKKLEEVSKQKQVCFSNFLTLLRWQN